MEDDQSLREFHEIRAEQDRIYEEMFLMDAAQVNSYCFTTESV